MEKPEKTLSSRKPRLISYRIRESPYYATTIRYGCKSFTTYNNMYLPLVYTDILSEYWSLKNIVAIWDVGCERQIEITGPDANDFLRRLTPRNLSNFQIGQCYYLPLTNTDGGIINDPVALRLGENHFWLSVADREILLWVKGVAAGLKMEVKIHEPEVSPLAVQGPKSFDLMADLLGNWVRSLKYFWFKQTELKGIPFVLSRTGWSKQGGYELFLQDERYGDKLWEIIMEAEEVYNIKPGAPCWIERIESGLLNYWEDINDNTNPYEVRLGKFVDLGQDVDFIGKNALKKIKSEGIKRKLVGLEIHTEPPSQSAKFWSVEINSMLIGSITSAVFSPDLKKNIAFAMVDIDFSQDGTNLVVDLGEKKVNATVTPLPFIDNRHKYLKGL